MLEPIGGDTMALGPDAACENINSAHNIVQII
jgi:hypothetical protein